MPVLHDQLHGSTEEGYTRPEYLLKLYGCSGTWALTAGMSIALAGWALADSALTAYIACSQPDPSYFHRQRGSFMAKLIPNKKSALVRTGMLWTQSQKVLNKPK